MKLNNDVNDIARLALQSVFHFNDHRDCGHRPLEYLGVRCNSCLWMKFCEIIRFKKFQ